MILDPANTDLERDEVVIQIMGRHQLVQPAIQGSFGYFVEYKRKNNRLPSFLFRVSSPNKVKVTISFQFDQEGSVAQVKVPMHNWLLSQEPSTLFQ